MANALFITGATGFVGRHLLGRLDPARYPQVYCLGRRPTAVAPGPFRIVEGDLADARRYAPALASTDTVIHLAAATGKAPREEYFRVNAGGTEVLLEAAERAGVRNFLYVSSIAVRYPDTSGYYYAQSKQLGEDAVGRSRLRFAIVRPTIILGRDAPAWTLLGRLSRAPITFLPGDGKTRIQPIYVDDLVDCLVSVLDDDLFTRDTFEVGGPEPVAFEAFLRTAHRLYHGKEPRVVHLPLAPLIRLLAILEKPLYSHLPITAGQLSAFRYDGTIRANSLFDRHAPRMKPVDDMLRLLVGHG
ncbi:MAG: NAD-dependent epimerase/dehydratase family protein [Candidatus Rokubacteria bacterium]|nr:NAD-dependent epimerase/dehydratase family protein [Candidatus Rokubacteria bacterium]